MCVVFIHVLALTLARPYVVLNNNYLAIFVDVQLFLTFFVSLLIQVGEGYESELYPIGFNNTFVLVMLLVTNISVVIVGVAMLKTDVKLLKEEFALRFRATGARVMLQGVPDGHYHCFLSHSQKHGQDQVASLKQTLARCISGIQIFLDVDTLDNVQDLPALVRRSLNIVLFTTEEVWSRKFIITEMSCAISVGVDVIVLREIDPRCVHTFELHSSLSLSFLLLAVGLFTYSHGAISLAKLKAGCPPHMTPVLFGREAIDYHRVLNFR
jgi:hypothetical protein